MRWCGTLHCVTGDETAQRALLDEALKKGALVWLYVDVPAALEGRGQARWYAWTGEHVYLLTGPGEQPDPGVSAGGSVRVVVRSKDNRHRLVAFDAAVSTLQPDDPDWDAATAELAKSRLNLPAADAAPSRWAAASSGVALYRLTPSLPLSEPAAEPPSSSHRAAPVPTTATTAGRAPWVLHKRGGPGRKLS